MAITDTQVPPASTNQQVAKSAERAFGFSLVFSGVRCVLQYAILPFVLPLFGVASDAAVPFLLLINVLAMVSIFYSLRRFFRIDYRYKWHYLGISIVTLTILTAFIIQDLFPALLESL